MSNDDFVTSDSSIAKPIANEVLVYPNPAQTKVNFKFETNLLGSVKADIIDINGNIVIHLFNGALRSNYLTWNGKNSGGLEAPAGIYFLHMRADNYDSAHKFVMLK